MNKAAQHLAQHLRAIYFGGNWSDSNLKDQLSSLSWQQATQPTADGKTILQLFHHLHYYIPGVSRVLQGGPLESMDKASWQTPSIDTQTEWDKLLKKAWTEAEHLAHLIEAMPEGKMWSPFVDEKYGTYFSNLLGLIEHAHYHLGQIKKKKKNLL